MIAQIRLIVFIRLGEIDIDDNALLLGLPMVARSLGLGIIIFFISFCVVNCAPKAFANGAFVFLRISYACDHIFFSIKFRSEVFLFALIQSDFGWFAIGQRDYCEYNTRYGLLFLNKTFVWPWDSFVIFIFYPFTSNVFLTNNQPYKLSCTLKQR